MSRLSIKQLHANLKALGIMDKKTNKAISYASFKNRTTIHRYGTKLKAVYMGQPNSNLFAFYTQPNNDTNTMLEAYELLLRLVKGDTTDYNDARVQWGNCAIPANYEDLKTK